MKVISLRLPDRIHADIVNIADMNNRSMNGQIVYILSRFLYTEGSDRRGKFMPTEGSGMYEDSEVPGLATIPEMERIKEDE